MKNINQTKQRENKMKSKLDNKFRHGTWYKGCGMTKREVLIKLHENLDIYLDKKPTLKQSDNLKLLDDELHQSQQGQAHPPSRHSASSAIEST